MAAPLELAMCSASSYSLLMSLGPPVERGSSFSSPRSAFFASSLERTMPCTSLMARTRARVHSSRLIRGIREDLSVHRANCPTRIWPGQGLFGLYNRGNRQRLKTPIPGEALEARAS